MSQVKIQGNASGTGIFTIASPNSNSNRTLDLPDNSGTVITTGSTAGVSQAMLASGVSGNGPAVGAYRSGNQTISSGVYTKIQFNIEEFDTNNCYDNTTNYRFTPNVAGYYQVNASQNNGPSTSPTTSSIGIFKNGSAFKYGAYMTAGNGMSTNVSAIVYCNGTTDYIEIYAYITASTAVLEGSSVANTYFNAAMVRAA
jgi:hypothetical protein